MGFNTLATTHYLGNCPATDADELRLEGVKDRLTGTVEVRICDFSKPAMRFRESMNLHDTVDSFWLLARPDKFPHVLEYSAVAVVFQSVSDVFG